MNDLMELKNYLIGKIDILKKKNDILNNFIELKSNIDFLNKAISNYEFEKMNVDDLKNVLSFIYPNEDITNKVNKIMEAISIIRLFNDDNIPQVETAKDYLKELNQILLSASRTLEMKIYKLNLDSNNKLDDYYEYLSLINDGEIVRHLNKDELNRFFIFLNNTSLDESVKYNLTLLFSKDSISYAEQLRKLNQRKQEIIISENAERIQRVIDEDNKVENDSYDNKQDELSLSADELDIYDKIMFIIDNYEKDKTLVHDSLVDLLKGDYSLDTRIKVYDSSPDKLNLIIEDLKENLLPSFKEHRNEIMIIFNYILEIFNHEYKKEEQSQFVSQVDDFTKEEQEEIEKYLSLGKLEFDAYDKFNEVDKNMIHSILELIKGGDTNTAGISERFSVNYVMCLELFRKLKESFDEYLEYRANEKEYVNEGLQDDINSCLNSQKSDILSLITRLKREYEVLNAERNITEEPLEERVNKDNSIILFLPLEDGNYCVYDDQKIILKEQKSVMNSIVSILHNLRRYEFYQSKDILGSRELQPSSERKIPDYTKEVKAYRNRSGDGRVAYVKLSVSAKNKEILSEAYGIDNPSVLLIIGCREKLNDSDRVPAYFNSRIAREIVNIRHVFDLFSSDFDSSSKSEAFGLIDDTYAIYDRLSKNPEVPLEDIDKIRK